MEFSEKKFSHQKNMFFTLFLMIFPIFKVFTECKKYLKFKKIEIFGNPIKKSSYSGLMCVNHPVSERISSCGHFGIFMVHTTCVMRYFIHTEVVAQIFKMGQIPV